MTKLTHIDFYLVNGHKTVVFLTKFASKNCTSSPVEITSSQNNIAQMEIHIIYLCFAAHMQTSALD